MIYLKSLLLETQASKRSMDAEQAVEIMQRALSKNSKNIFATKRGQKMEIVAETKYMNSEMLSKIVKTANILGYYPSAFRHDEIVISKEDFTKFSFQKALDSLNSEKWIIITLDKIHDHKLFLTDPGVIGLSDFTWDPGAIGYHVSLHRKEKKILSIGLVPKSGNKIGMHPSRIYLFPSVEDCEDLIKLGFPPDSYTIFEVNLSGLKNGKRPDPHLKKAFYVIDNIPPQNLKVVKRINTKKMKPKPGYIPQDDPMYRSHNLRMRKLQRSSKINTRNRN